MIHRRCQFLRRDGLAAREFGIRRSETVHRFRITEDGEGFLQPLEVLRR